MAKGMSRGEVMPSMSSSRIARRQSAPGVVQQSKLPKSPRSSFGSNASKDDLVAGQGDVSLCVRLRPGPEESTCAQVKGAHHVRLQAPAASYQSTEQLETTYVCDHAFGADATQGQVYKTAVSPICEGVLRGYNGAVIAYGQTGSGKTHTMIGNTRDSNQGVAPRAIKEIFAALAKSENWTVEVTVLEIYNEKVRDLLTPRTGSSVVEIHEVCKSAGNGMTFHCPDATRRRTSTPEDALVALCEGMRRRETACTDMNHNSSRSHLVFTLTVTQSDPDLGATLRGRLHIADLAGSERLKRSMASEFNGASTPPRHSPLTPRSPRDQRREAGEINKSLSQLALVIQRLTGPKTAGLSLVPYRDSMLTRLLADSFGGSSKTCLIITCSSLTADREETRCSLEFGKRAKLVKNKAEINLEVKHEVTPVMQAIIQKELADLYAEKEEMLKERDAFFRERAELQAQLENSRFLLHKAAEDVQKRHELHMNDVKQLEKEKEALRCRWAEAIQQSLSVLACETRQIEELKEARIATLQAEGSQLSHEWRHALAYKSKPSESTPRLSVPYFSESPECSTVDASVDDSSDAEHIGSQNSLDCPFPESLPQPSFDSTACPFPANLPLHGSKSISI